MQDAYRQVKGRLDLAVSDLGPTQLKNIAEPIRVYSLEVGKPATAGEAAARSLPSRRSARGSRLLGAGIAALVIRGRGGRLVFPRRQSIRARRR